MGNDEIPKLRFYNPKGGAVRAVQWSKKTSLSLYGLESEELGNDAYMLSAKPGPRDINGAARRSMVKEGDYVVIFPWGGFEVVPAERFTQAFSTA